MFKKYTASLLSAAIVATSLTTAPARADSDVAKVLGGLVIIGALAKALDDKNDRNRHRSTGTIVKPHVSSRSRIHTQRTHRSHRGAKIANRRCLSQTWTHRGARQVYGARCLQGSVRAQLPQNCLRKNHTNNGPRHFYGRECLIQHGWRA